MAKYLSILLIFILSCAQNQKLNSPTPSKLVDDIGTSIELNRIPQKVITLAPNLTEMIYELGEGNKLVGNTKFCNFPNEAKMVEKVGDMLTVDYEKIVTLKPDLIFMTVVGNTKNSYNKLKNLGQKIFVSNPTNYNGIKKTFLNMGKIFGKEKMATEKTVMWDSVINDIKKYAQKIKNPKAMFLVALKPIMLVGGNSFINDIMSTVGLKNIADDAKLNYPILAVKKC